MIGGTISVLLSTMLSSSQKELPLSRITYLNENNFSKNEIDLYKTAYKTAMSKQNSDIGFRASVTGCCSVWILNYLLLSAEYS